MYLTKPPPIRLDHLAAAALHGGPRAVVSGAAALADYGLPVRPPSQELVLVPLGCGARSGGRIVVRPTARLPEPELRPGPPLAPPARAIADHVLTARDLGAVQMVLGAAIQDDLCTVAELTAELAAGPRRGSRLFREALQDINHNAHSAQEARAGRLLRTAGVSGFEQNVKVPFGTRWFVADFLWRAERAILEIDSRQYHFRPEDQASTRRRDQLLQTDGWAVLHVAPSELRGAEGGRAFVTLVQRWLAALRRRGGLPTR
ncbi:MAG: DUF559 domain-containing protein [Actinomycetia bacterium]|nr:DUF559 domain-containing protein [Actinomycetes bacterium]